MDCMGSGAGEQQFEKIQGVGHKKEARGQKVSQVTLQPK